MMGRYIAKRLIYGLLVMFAVVTVVFFGVRALPGGPVRTMLGMEATEAAVRQLRQQLGLNRPIWVQYIDWLTDLPTLNWGRSLSTSKQVTTLIGNAAPRTLSIALVGGIISIVVAIPAGIISAVYKGKPVDYVVTIAAFIGLSSPAFFIGILLAVVIGVWLGWLPVFGYSPLSEGVVPWLKGILLPAIAVGTPAAAIVMRMMRSSLLDVIGEDYMKTAEAKGVPKNTRLVKHAIPNALLPVVTVMGIQLALLLTRAVTVEIVFGIQGIGRLLVTTILTRDYPVTQIVIIIIAGVMVLMNIVVDLLYLVIDPRIRYGGESL